jgi:hypothetical protein
MSVIIFTGSNNIRAMCWSEPREKTTVGMFGAQKNYSALISDKRRWKYGAAY